MLSATGSAVLLICSDFLALSQAMVFSVAMNEQQVLGAELKNHSERLVFLLVSRTTLRRL